MCLCGLGCGWLEQSLAQGGRRPTGAEDCLFGLLPEFGKSVQRS